MALFGKKKAKLPSYEGASLEALIQDPQWSFALGQAGLDPSRCEVVLRLADCTVGDGGMPVNARPALLLGQGSTLAVAFPGERDVRVVKRDTSRAELQTQRSGMFQILFGPANNLDGFMFYGHEDNLVANTPEGDAFGQAMLAFLRGQLQPQQVVGTPQSISASPPSKPSAPPSAAPEFADAEDATRWQMVHAVHSSLIDMMDKYQLCFEKAENVEKAYSMTTVGHEISRENFRKHAEEAEKELEALLLGLREATVAAQSQWNDLMFLLPGEDNDIMKLANWCMANGVDSEVMSSIAANGMFTRTDFGTTRSSFWTENERVIAVMNNANQQG
jgi:hypothetical protein